MHIAIIGGTGGMGFGLGLRLAYAGHHIFIGSRTEEKAMNAAALMLKTLPKATVSGKTNAEAAALADLVILSVPNAGHAAILERLKNILKRKKVLDITVPLAFNPLRYFPPKEGSNAQETEMVLGEGCLVAAGLHTVSATLLTDLAHPINAHAFVVANHAVLKETVIQLCGEIGITAYDAGSLHFSGVIESLTPLLLGMNKRYGSKHIGFQLVGFPEEV